MCVASLSVFDKGIEREKEESNKHFNLNRFENPKTVKHVLYWTTTIVIKVYI